MPIGANSAKPLRMEIYNHGQKKCIISVFPPWNRPCTLYIQTRLPQHTMAENLPPSGYKHLTDVEIAKCLTLAKNKWTQEAIADDLGCSQSTVQRTLTKYTYETFVMCKQTSGRQRKTTTDDDRHLIITAKCNYDKPLADITNLSGLNISIKTTTHRLKEVDLISRYKWRKPFLKPKHKTARLEWACTYKDWTIEDWKKVIFSDECLMRIGVDPHRQRVVRSTSTALEECYLLPSFKSG